MQLGEWNSFFPQGSSWKRYYIMLKTASGCVRPSWAGQMLAWSMGGWTAADAESQWENVDSIALSHWGPKKHLCHDGTRGGVGWSLSEILSLSAPLCILFLLEQVHVHMCAYIKVSVLAQLLWAKLQLVMWNPCSFSGAWFVTDGKVRGCGQFPVQILPCGSYRSCLLTASTMSVSRSSEPEDWTLAEQWVLSGQQGKLMLSLPAGKVGKEPQARCCFQGVWKDTSLPIRKKQWLVFCLWESQMTGKSAGSRVQERERRMQNLNCRERIPNPRMF